MITCKFLSLSILVAAVLESQLIAAKLSIEPSSTSSPSNIISVHLITSWLMSKLFPDCDVIVVRDNRVSIPSFSLLHNQLNDDLTIAFRSHLQFELNNSSKPNGLYLPPRASEPYKEYFSPFAALSKHRGNCALPIMMLNDSSDPLLFKFLFNFLTPKHREISKKDEDHYVFIAPASEAPKIMFEKTFSAKIKYKLMIELQFESESEPSPSFSEGPHLIHSTCFFCNGGYPSYIPLEIDVTPMLQLEEVDTVQHRAWTQKLFPDFVRDYNGSNLIAAISTRTSQRSEMTRDKNGNYHRKRGLYFIILDVLKERMNFRLKIVPSFGDGGTGLLLKNGTWLGSVANILHETAHIGMVSAQTFQRNEVVGFAFSLQYEWITFTTGRPKPIYSWRTMFKPFTYWMWFAVVSSTVGVIGTFVFMSHFLPRRWLIGEIFQYIVGSILEQSYKSPKYSSVLVLCTIWLMFGVIVSTVYRSKLFTFLVFPDLTVAPTTFEELANSPDFKWGLAYVKGAAYAVFATSTEKTYVKIFKNWDLIESGYECFNRTTRENFACISWKSIAEHNAHKNFTDRSGRRLLVEAPESTFFIPCGFVLEKRAIFKPNFDKILHWGHDTGLVMKWEDMDWTYVRKMRFDWERTENITAAGSSIGQNRPKPLTNKSLIGAYSLLFILTFVSMLGYVAELSYCRYKATVTAKQKSFLAIAHVTQAVVRLQAFSTRKLLV